MAWEVEAFPLCFKFEQNLFEVAALISPTSTFTALFTTGIVTESPIPGTHSMRFGANGYFSAVLTAQKTRCITFYLNVTATDQHVFSFSDGGTAQVDCYLTGQKIVLQRGSTVLTQSAALSVAWHLIQIGVSIDSTNGALVLCVDRLNLIPLSGINTQVSSNASSDRVVFPGMQGPGPEGAIANLIFLTSAVPNVLAEPLPPTLIVAPDVPVADGADQDWAPSTAPPFACVNVPGRDSSYISSSTPDAKSTFVFPALTGQACWGIGTVIRGLTPEPGTTAISALMRLGGVDYPAPTGATLAVTVGEQASFFWPVRPSDSTPFDITDNPELGANVTLVDS